MRLQSTGWARTGTGGARRFARLALCAGLAGLAAACGTSTERSQVQTGASAAGAPIGRYKVGKPYQIKGVWYYPAIDYEYVEEGVASWYGPGFHGKQTANGEIYDQNDMTAAHRTLPMPSVVRVTNLENGRSLKLTVNDRGPFARNRIIDVSRRAAQLLGFHMAGTTQVRVEIEAEESRQLALALTGSEYPGQAQLASRQATVAAVPPPAVVAAVPEPAVDQAFGEAASAAATSYATVPVQPVAAEAAAGVDAAAMAPLPLPADPLPSDPADPPIVDIGGYAGQSAPGQSAPGLSDPGLSDSGLSYAGQSYAPVTGSATRLVSATPFGEAGRAWIQAGAFAERGNAEKARAQLVRLGPVAVTPSLIGGRDLYRVRVGPLPSFDDADRLLAQVIRSGFPGSHVVVE